MARKLQPEEEEAFVQALRAAEPLMRPAGDDPFLRSLSDKRDTALLLTPELGAWFDKEFPDRPRCR